MDFHPGDLSSQSIRNKKWMGPRLSLSHGSPCPLSAASGVCVVSYWMMSSTRLNPTLNFHPWKKLLEPQCQFLLELPSEVLEPRRYVLGTPPQGCPSSESIHSTSAPSSAFDLLLVARSVWVGTLRESLPKAAQLGRWERKALLGVRVTQVKLEGHG